MKLVDMFDRGYTVHEWDPYIVECTSNLCSRKFFISVVFCQEKYPATENFIVSIFIAVSKQENKTWYLNHALVLARKLLKMPCEDKTISCLSRLRTPGWGGIVPEDRYSPKWKPFVARPFTERLLGKSWLRNDCLRISSQWKLLWWWVNLLAFNLLNDAPACKRL